MLAKLARELRAIAAVLDCAGKAADPELHAAANRRRNVLALDHPLRHAVPSIFSRRSRRSCDLSIVVAFLVALVAEILLG